MLRKPVHKRHTYARAKGDCKCYLCGKAEPAEDLYFIARAKTGWSARHKVCHNLVNLMYYGRYRDVLNVLKSTRSDDAKVRALVVLRQDIDEKLRECKLKIEKFRLVFQEDSTELDLHYRILAESWDFVSEAINDLVPEVSASGQNAA